VTEQYKLWSIAEVERHTGLGKDTLRVWERRYGFPLPGRDDQGQRVYTQTDVDRLRMVSSLLRAGHRPGRVVAMNQGALMALLESECADLKLTSESTGTQQPLIDAAFEAVCRYDGLALRRHLQQALSRLGLANSVVEVVAPLNDLVGSAWIAGQLRVGGEHLYTEMVHGVLRQAMLSLPEPDPVSARRVLLTTLPGEPHGLGLLMAEVMCTLEGAVCVNLGVQTPVDEIVAAAQWHRSDVVGLSATGTLPSRWLRDGVIQLRHRLPVNTALWLGGAASAGPRGVRGVQRMTDLRAIGPALAALLSPPDPALPPSP
jgi:methanogenic corrinoid protein MtbC1